MKKSNLPSKLCIVCKRPFNWRKKWKLNWDKSNIVQKDALVKEYEFRKIQMEK